MKFACNDCDALVLDSEVIISSFEEGTAFFCENCWNKLKEEETTE